MENFQYNKAIGFGKFSKKQKALVESVRLCCGKHILEHFLLNVNKSTESFQGGGGEYKKNYTLVFV